MKQLYSSRTRRGRIGGLRWLLLFLLAFTTLPALATHFRYGSISWVHVASPARTVKFVIKQAWRWNYPWPGGANPAVNQVVTTGTFAFGDGSSTNVNLRVTSINVAENWFSGEVELTKTYAGSARDTFTAVFQGCCKISEVSQFASGRFYQPNNRDGDYINITKVKLGLGNSSPVSSMPAYINLPTGTAAASYQLPATDPDGNPLRYYLTNTVPYASPYNQTQPPGISIDSNGLLTMPTFRPVVSGTNYAPPYVATSSPYPLSTLISGVQVPTMFNGSVTIVDNQGALIQSDFLIRIVGASKPPVFEYPTSAKPGPTPANGTTYVIHPGTPLTFTARAHDADTGAVISLNASGMPAGAGFTPQSTGGPDTAQSVFTWTPTASQFGTQQINITAQDNAGIQTSTIVNIVVTLAPEFTGPGNNSTFCVVPGTTFTQTYGAFNSDPLRNVRIKSASGSPALPPGLSFSSQSLPTSFGNPVSTTLSWTPSGTDWGVHAITMLAENQTTLETATHTVNLLVNTTPVITSLPVTSVYSGQLYSYTLSITDADIAQGDHVHLESAVLPSFLSIVDNHDGTYTISGTPSFADAAGSPYSIQLRFHDHLNETYGTQCGMVTQAYLLDVQPCNVTSADSTVAAACFGTSTGAVYLSVNNASLPVSYAWSRNGTPISAATKDLSGVAAGTYTVAITDANGCSAADTATVAEPALLTVSGTVTNALCADGTGSVSTTVTGGTMPYSYLWTPGKITTSGIGNAAPGSYSLSVMDANGCTASGTYTIAVLDSISPVITSNGDKSVSNASGTCGAVVEVSASATDNCLVGTPTGIRSDALPLTAVFPVGTTTITWNVTDNNGNAAIPVTQTVIVTDNEAPAVSCPGNISICNNPAGNPLTVTLPSSDNCSPTTTSWVITGASSASGTGNIITRSFNAGTSNIYWQVRDAANNLSVCTTTVLVRPLPTVSITASDADAFCNATTLTAGIAPAGAATYAWTYNSAAFASTQSVKLKLGNGDGLYSVVATDQYGCNSAAATYNFQKQALVNMYVLLGMKEVDLAQSNDVINGSVGVTSSHGEANFDKYCSVASPGAFVKAADINTKSSVTIPTKVYSQAVVTLPTMYTNTSNPSGLSNFVMTTNGTVTGDKKDLTVNSNKTVTVTGSIFRKIRICHGADVTFAAADISLASLDVDQGATVRFSGNTRLRVSDEVSIDNGCSINPGARVVTFYIKDPSSGSYNCWGNWSSWHSWLGGSSEKFVVHGKGTNIIANVYIPDGKIRVHGNGWDGGWYESESCNMMGLFIAEEIQGDGKNINWYSYDCSMPASFRQVARTAPVEEAADFGVVMYPNPTNGEFSLQFSNTAEAAEVRILDIQGRLIGARTIGVSEMPSAAFSIAGKAAGVYMVEIHQGAKTVRNRIVLR